jgi:hypothetical protein
MNTTISKPMATLNFQIDLELYERLKEELHKQKTSIAKWYRNLTLQKLAEKDIPSERVKLYYESNIQTIDWDKLKKNEKLTTLPNDFSTIPNSASFNDVPVYRMPSSIRFQGQIF